MRVRPGENRWIGLRIDDPAIDIAGYAKALGVDSAGPVETVGELVAAVDKGLKVVESGRPYVLDVHVAPGYAQPPPARSAG